MVTILIPTANRPELLAMALQSVSLQTAASEIAEIIVSENAGDRRSDEVCRNFPSLPITYIFREPQMPPFEHGHVLLKHQWSGEFIAILHDDDWWTPDFLSKGIEALRAHPRASVFCCNSYEIKKNDGALLSPTCFYFWFGANYPSFEPIWQLGLPEVLLASLIHTPAHYSTILARADALRNSASIFETGNRFDNDRMLIFELSRQGTLLYSPFPQSFNRVHVQQDTHSFSSDRQSTQMCRTSEWMIDRSGESWGSVGNRFYERALNCPVDARNYLHALALRPWTLPVLLSRLDASSDLAAFGREIRSARGLKDRLLPFCPPILLENKDWFHRLIRR